LCKYAELIQKSGKNGAKLREFFTIPMLAGIFLKVAFYPIMSYTIMWLSMPKVENANVEESAI